MRGWMGPSPLTVLLRVNTRSLRIEWGRRPQATAHHHTHHRGTLRVEPSCEARRRGPVQRWSSNLAKPHPTMLFSIHGSDPTNLHRYEPSLEGGSDSMRNRAFAAMRSSSFPPSRRFCARPVSPYSARPSVVSFPPAALPAFIGTIRRSDSLPPFCLSPFLRLFGILSCLFLESSGRASRVAV